MTQQADERRRLAALKEAGRWLAKMDEKERLGGPKTKAGKRISSRNSRKHGITSKEIERRFDEGLDVPDWLFCLADQLRDIADETDPLDGLLVRKALIAAWRAGLAQEALDMEMATSLYPGAAINKTHTGWLSDAAHGLINESSEVSTKGAKKLSYYVSRYRSERDNAIRMLRKRNMDRAPRS